MTETSIGYLNDWSFLTLHWRKLQKVDVDGSLCGIDSCSKQERIKVSFSFSHRAHLLAVILSVSKSFSIAANSTWLSPVRASHHVGLRVDSELAFTEHFPVLQIT